MDHWKQGHHATDGGMMWRAESSCIHCFGFSNSSGEASHYGKAMKVYCVTIYFSNSDSALSGTKVTGGKNGEALAAKLSSDGAEVYQIQDSIPEPATAPQVKNGTCYPQQSAGRGPSL